MSSDRARKVLISDSLSQEGVKKLEQAGIQVKMDPSLDGDTLKKAISEYDGLIIRSGTTVTGDIIENGKNLKIIGRAGVGVDNVDIQAATRKGVIVMNTPSGNTISACEHTWALLLSLVRNVPRAHQSLKEGKWDKKNNEGTEIFGKTLGIVGLGKIGYEVAKRALSFGMKVLVHDPYTTEEVAKEVKAELVEFEELLEKSDIITIHAPKNEKTKNMISVDAIYKMKEGVFIVNCARGGIVDEKAVADAVKTGKIRGAAFDVYDKEPTTESPVIGIDGIVHTPHLGASTEEAQERVATEIVDQIIQYFTEGKIINAVNITGSDLDPSLAELATKLGILCGRMSEHLTDSILISYKEQTIGGQEDAIVRAVLNGYLSQFNEGVNYINAILIAEEKGIGVIRQKLSSRVSSGDISISLGDEFKISGVVLGGAARLMEINGYIVDVPLSGSMLVIKNSDIPGVIGHIGTVLGAHGVNIASMEVGRKSAGGQAVTVIAVDHKVDEKVIEELKSEESIIDVKNIEVGQ
ncbi:MAG: phosphoglycerate dehydrogenase [Elusimicrobiota bacterium]